MQVMLTEKKNPLIRSGYLNTVIEDLNHHNQNNQGKIYFKSGNIAQ